MNEEELRRRLREELLKPNGRPLGAPSRARGVYRVPEGRQGAEELFSRLAALGRNAPLPTHPGSRVEIHGLGYVGYRPTSKSGEPTIDVNVSIEGLENVKFKYVGRGNT